MSADDCALTTMEWRIATAERTLCAMAIISEHRAQQLRELFVAQASERVTILLFTADAGLSDALARASDDARALLEEVVALAPGYLSLEARGLVDADEAARALGIERAPAFVLRGKAAGLVRTFGAPTNYEFTTLISDLLLLVAGGQTELDASVQEALALLDAPVHLQVFVAPT